MTRAERFLDAHPALSLAGMLVACWLALAVVVGSLVALAYGIWTALQ